MSKRFVNPAAFASWCLVFLISLIWQPSVPALAQSQPQVDLTGKNVLVIHTGEANVPVFLKTDKGLSTTLESGGISDLNQFFESLNLRLNPGLEYRKALVEKLRLQYGHRKVDVIITMYPEALEFVLRDCGDIFPDVPIIALYLQKSLALSNADRTIVEHTATLDITGTLEIALSLVPGVKRVYVVSGVHEVDRQIEEQARRDLKKWETRLEFHYLSHMPFEDMLATVSNVPSDSILLLLVLVQDVKGARYTTPTVAQRLSQVSAAPIFGIVDSGLGYGIVGGSLLYPERIGSKAGELALDFLRGILPPRDAAKILNVFPVPMFDWRQLERWNLSEGALPKGSVVINREFTLWDFKYYIIGVIAFCLAESALIIFLIVQRRRKKVAEEELNQFFNVSLDLLCIANTDGYFLRLNPAIEKVLGYTRQELMAKRFLDFVHPDDLDRTREAVSILVSQQKVFSFENRYRCKDGTYRWLQWSSAPAGKLIYAAARDVTEGKRAEEMLRESQERFSQVAETVGDFIWEVDSNGLYRYASPSVEKILGYTPGELIGKMHFYDLFVPEVREELKTAAFSVFATKQEFRTLSNPKISKEGKVVHLETSGVPVLDETGNLLAYRGADTDVTERKQIESEASHARREMLRMERLSRMGELVASLAHELNQPLAAILSSAQAALRFLQSTTPDLDLFRSILQNIVQDDKRAAGVITSLRSMVKREKREKELLDINEVLQETLTLFRGEAIIRNVEIKTGFDSTLPPVSADKIQLQQVVLNLVMNAAEAMSEMPSQQRRILLRTQATDHGIQVTVRDFGPGINVAKLNDIWQPFFTTKSMGMGMGLSVSGSIIRAHGGRIWAENNPDGGATFVFEIPAMSVEH